MLEPGPATLSDRAFQIAGGGAALLFAAVSLWIVGDLLWHGAGDWSWTFLTADPSNAGRDGGIAPILVSTLLILAICLSIAVPLGLATAVLLAGFTVRQGRLAGLVRGALDVLAGTPSIVFGLFGSVFFGEILGFGYSLVTGGATLACMVLPILVRVTEAGIRDVPERHRLAAAALGCSRSGTLLHVLLPSAAPALVAGVILGLGRAASETAALLFTSGYVDRWPSSLLDPGRALSIHIYDLAMNAPGGEQRACASAALLLVLLLLINLAAHGLGSWWMRGREDRA